MSFILLLLLGITTLAQVEQQGASLGLRSLEARMNAKLGAMLALGDLQRYTGPDQRVTARSDILVEAGTMPLLGQGRWTGVWSSRSDMNDADNLDGLSGRRPRWLVSGESPDAETAVNTSEVVRLATVGGSIQDKSSASIDDSVEVAVETIPGQSDTVSGRFAYWVSDEGVKARLDLADPYLSEGTVDESYYRRAIPQVADPTSVTNFEGEQPLATSASLWKTPESNIEKISSIENIAMFLKPALPERSTSAGIKREFFHDFSVSSRSVLSNTKNGGLRRDLSSALASAQLPEDLEGAIFEPAGGTVSAGNPGGPKWEQLSDYYTLADSLPNGPVQMRMPTNDQVGIVPVVTRWNFLFHPFAGYIGSGTTGTTGTSSSTDGFKISDYEYSLGFFPLITLWNPYDRDLVLPDEGIGVEASLMAKPVLLESSGSSTVVVNFPTIRWKSGSVYRNPLQFVIKGGVTIPAGRAINFTPPKNSFLSLTDPKQNVLVPGSTGTLVRGFFTQPVGSSSAADFLDNGGRVPSQWQHTTFPARPVLALRNARGKDQGMWTQTLNLYDLSVDSNFDIQGSNRFKSLTFKGLNALISSLNVRVMRLNRAMGTLSAASGKPGLLDLPTTFRPVIAEEGESKKWAGSNTSIPISNYEFDYESFKDWEMAGRHSAISTALKFPDVPIDDRDRKIHLLRQFNPTASFVSRQEHLDTEYRSGPWYLMYTWGEKYTYGSPWNDFSKDLRSGTDDLFAPLGWSNREGVGSDRMIVYELPKSKPLSVGHLMHANLMNITEGGSGFNNGIPEISDGSAYAGYKWYSNIQQPYAAPAYAIGNSEADVHIPLGLSKSLITIRSSGGNTYRGAHYDYSYELNDALWDGFFFSGVDRTNGLPLPNARLSAWSADGQVDMDSLVDEQRSATQIVMDGGFNINSTSVAAWESILGSMREIETLGEAPSEADQLHNYSRFLAPVAPSSGTVPSPDEGESLTAGYRNLTDSQISALAREIVTEIRNRCSAADSNGDRYPFLSLSGFINRSLDTTIENFAYRGALQAAIDRSSINGMATSESSGDGLWQANAVTDLPNYGEKNYQMESRPMAEGMLGYLMQADLLNKIGSILQARSDTFTIRSFGSAYSEIEGADTNSAYLEMVVQRLPVYVDPSDAAEEFVDLAVDFDDELPLSKTNLEFGRRYKIVSTRWLEPGEI